MFLLLLLLLHLCTAKSKKRPKKQTEKQKRSVVRKVAGRIHCALRRRWLVFAPQHSTTARCE